MSADPVRPAFHGTAPAGWINDPLGVTWHETRDGGRYELFVQYNPDAPEWTPACRWGQLTSPDLVHWSWVGTALEPAAGEDGCWSGAVLVDDAGTPVIVYTSVLSRALDLGRIALAHGDRQWRRWTPDPRGPVLAGPPAGLAVTHFRDPFLWRGEDAWRMVVGAGLADGRAAALQYSSPDLRTWRFDGVVADRAAAEVEPLGTGSVWECVQLFPLDGAWVLLVSAWEDGSPQRVACAVGDYDGRRFAARAWQRFTATDAVYATTTFVDAAGRRCALSWIRERGPAGGAWAGELSLPVVLGREGDRVVLEPHPDIARLRTGRPAGTALAGGESVELEPGPAFDLELRAEVAAGSVTVTLVDDDGELLAVLVDRDGVAAARPGRGIERLAVPASSGLRLLRLIVDAGIAELFAGRDGGVFRIRSPAGPLRLRLSASAGAGVPAAVLHSMPIPRPDA